MKNHARILLTALSLLSVGHAAYSQTNPNLEQGFKPFGSYDETDFDSVSMTNHNLTVNIPFFDYPQRGSLHSQVKFLYNNKNYIVKLNCTGTCVAYWSWVVGSYGGGLGPFLEDGAVTTSYRTFTYNGQVITTYTANTSDGSVHQLTGNVHGGYESFDGTGLWW